MIHYHCSIFLTQLLISDRRSMRTSAFNKAKPHTQLSHISDPSLRSRTFRRSGKDKQDLPQSTSAKRERDSHGGHAIWPTSGHGGHDFGFRHRSHGCWQGRTRRWSRSTARIEANDRKSKVKPAAHNGPLLLHLTGWLRWEMMDCERKWCRFDCGVMKVLMIFLSVWIFYVYLNMIYFNKIYSRYREFAVSIVGNFGILGIFFLLK